MSWTFFFFFFLPGYVGVFLAHFHKSFFVRSVLGDKLSVVEQVPSFLKMCPNHQELAWAAKLPEELATRTLHRKRTSKERHHLWWVEPFFFLLFFVFFFAGLCWSIFCTLSHMFSVRSVLGDKASVVEQVPSFLKIGQVPGHPRRQVVRRGAGAKLPENWPPGHCTGRGPVKKGIIFGELNLFFLLFFAGLCWSIFCTLSHMFSVRSVLGDKASVVEQVPSWKSATSTLHRKRTSQQRHHVWWVEHFAVVVFALFFLGVCMGVWEWMCEWMSFECHSGAQTLDRGERCLGPDLQCPR